MLPPQILTHTAAEALHALASSFCFRWGWAQKVRSHDRFVRGYVFHLLESYFLRKSSNGNDLVRGRQGDLEVSRKKERKNSARIGCFFRPFVSSGVDEKRLSEISLNISWTVARLKSGVERLKAELTTEFSTPSTTFCVTWPKKVLPLPSASAYLGFRHVTWSLRFLPSLIPIAALKSVFVVPDHHGIQESCWLSARFEWR